MVIKVPETDWSAIKRMIDDGDSVAYIAKLYGISRDTIYKRARRDGWKIGNDKGIFTRLRIWMKNKLN